MKKAVNVSCSDRVKQYPKGVLPADVELHREFAVILR
jgi:hypothetical protein